MNTATMTLQEMIDEINRILETADRFVIEQAYRFAINMTRED